MLQLEQWKQKATEAEARIRELEQMWNEMKEGHEQETDMVITLTRRIAKAKAILEGFRVSTFGKVADPVIDDVLAALEGK